VIIPDQNGSRLAVLFDTREEAQRKVEQLQSAGFETWRVNIINYAGNDILCSMPRRNLKSTILYSAENKHFISLNTFS
jgi:hypothetical protein